ncbi:MAG: DUF503 domain-containing protein [Deltaproteobacteria bacterium]|jgi:uncharacterized protein YlxP (DUF503 family)|nr:DUF503 domain-containing protein [Deltaproteobacteria bacterium]TFG61367.1 MAG: DUF503 domain-containing protein [Deltaproteobacteria bacterium]
MLVAVMVADLLFPGSDSLKDKRRRLAGLTSRVRARFPVSVAEVGLQDLRQRGRIGVALVSTDSRLAQSILDQITDVIGRDGEIEMIDRRIEILQMDDGEP